MCPTDRHIDGVAKKLLDATQINCTSLDGEVYGSGLALSDPMQLVSGFGGRERTHFDTPDATRLNTEVKHSTYRASQQPNTDPAIKSTISHLLRVTVYPFEDGNGHNTQAMTVVAMAWSDNGIQRLHSMSTQKAGREISSWLPNGLAHDFCLCRRLNEIYFAIR